MHYTVTGYSLHGHPLLTFYTENGQEALKLSDAVAKDMPSIVKLTVQAIPTVNQPRVIEGWNRCNDSVRYFDGK